MQAGGGLVEDIQGAAGLTLGEFAGELDALGFAAGEGGGGLGRVGRSRGRLLRAWLVSAVLGIFSRSFKGFRGWEIQDIGNGMAFEADG